MVALLLVMKGWHSLSQWKGDNPSSKASVAFLLLMKKATLPLPMKWRKSFPYGYTFYIPFMYSLHTYLPDTFYVLPISLLIHSVRFLYILYVPSIYPINTLYIPSIYLLYTFYIPSIPLLHTLDIRSTYLVSIPSRYLFRTFYLPSI